MKCPPFDRFAPFSPDLKAMPSKLNKKTYQFLLFRTYIPQALFSDISQAGPNEPKGLSLRKGAILPRGRWPYPPTAAMQRIRTNLGHHCTRTHWRRAVKFSFVNY
ncbi:hypothetical protein ES332_A08G199200v1 [Gossypium tomentosum]|uniref:Uncharacterized protein n=1 Tax=Gossypium tomentosum TaxID=34277 RepID=A0A5D2PH53_GOSTO|nr:hypothetical protein ES332_A08G199200v1 [Gossypium tomentosum]